MSQPPPSFFGKLSLRSADNRVRSRDMGESRRNHKRRIRRIGGPRQARTAACLWWRSASQWFKGVLAALTPARAFAFVSLILLPSLAIYVTTADSDLVMLRPGDAEVIRGDVTVVKDDRGWPVGASSLIHLNLDFQNRGLKPGHIANIDLRTFPTTKDLTFAVHHVDRTVLRWRERKRLHFEFVATTSESGHQHYQVVFIDSDGRQVAQIQQELTMSFDLSCQSCP